MSLTQIIKCVRCQQKLDNLDHAKFESRKIWIVPYWNGTKFRSGKIWIVQHLDRAMIGSGKIYVDFDALN